MIRWGYAINQYNPQFDDFVRRRDHQRALRTIAVSGFSGVELSAGTGRWEPLGNPTQVAANFGDVAGFKSFVAEAALDGVSSWYWDPTIAFQEDLSHGTDPADPEARALLVEHARWFASALEQLGGDVLVARPARAAGNGLLSETEFDAVVETWNTVGRVVSEYGVVLSLHFDFLSALRDGDGLERLVAETDPSVVGFAVDTAEFAIAGLDPTDFVQRYAKRVNHVQLKNATAVDELEEYRQPAAEFNVLRAGGNRRIPRWFTELGEAEGIVDVVGFVRALAQGSYDGWIVVESDFTPHPSTSVMLNGWQVQKELAPILDSH